MPLRTEEIDLESECDRLEDEMETLAEEVSQMDDSTPEQLAAQTIQEGRDLETYSNFLRDLAAGDVVGLPAMESVTLAGLTSGELDLVEDITEKHSNMRRRHAWVAVGTRGEAPYLKHDPEEALTVGGCEETAVRVADLPRPFVGWAEEKIAELSHLGEDRGNGFLELASAKATQTEEGGS